jgi:hypothetical protein
MRRALSGLIAAFLLLAAPLAAQGGAKQDSAKKPAPKAGAKADTAKAAAKAPPKADQTKQGAGKSPAKTDQTKQPAAKAPAKTDQTKQPAAAGTKPDTGKGVNLAEAGGKNQMTIMREVFTYEPAGRRDPMLSLANTATLRPLLSEIECIGILYDEDGRNSEAVMRSLDKKKTYRVKVGQMLGRMTVAQITRREVVFTIDEYGFSRQVSLPVKPDTSIARTP